MTNVEQCPGPSAYLEYKLHRNDDQTKAALAALREHEQSCNTCHDHGRRRRKCTKGVALDRAYNVAYNTAPSRKR